MSEGTSTNYIWRRIPNMTVKLVMDILESPSISYTEYRVNDGDRPDTVAAKIYGASRYAWIILVANNMRDLYDWPLSDLEFTDYMNRKYETTAGAYDGYDASKDIIAKNIWITPSGTLVEVDDTFYNTLSVAERMQITIYDVEYQENDDKRKIRVPTLGTIDTLNSELNRLLSI